MLLSYPAHARLPARAVLSYFARYVPVDGFLFFKCERLCTQSLSCRHNTPENMLWGILSTLRSTDTQRHKTIPPSLTPLPPTPPCTTQKHTHDAVDKRRKCRPLRAYYRETTVLNGCRADVCLQYSLPTSYQFHPKPQAYRRPQQRTHIQHDRAKPRCPVRLPYDKIFVQSQSQLRVTLRGAARGGWDYWRRTGSSERSKQNIKPGIQVAAKPQLFFFWLLFD